MRKRAFVSCICASLLAVSIAAGAELPEGFRLEPFVSGLTEPWDVADTPDGLILIAERTTGQVRYVRWGELQLNSLCTVAVNATGERGLLGLAVHPDYAENGWIYLYYTDLSSGNNKVTRFTVSQFACQDPLDILPNLGVGGAGKRNGGGIDFSPFDGKLYVSTGDMEVSANGQSLSGLQAKVLRLNDDGSIPGDNPTPGSALYTRGVRDPRSLTVNFLGRVFLSDQGQGVPPVFDEVNLAPSNGNLGWAVKSGSGAPAGYDDPLKAWSPIVGAHGVVDYDGVLFPQVDSDLKDNDGDKYGPDRLPGIAQTDDNNVGECIGSGNNGGSCTSVLDCFPARTGESPPQCEKRDEPAELCLASVTTDDDDCDNVGAAGIDEPDESYFLDVFTAKSSSIDRAVLMGANSDQLSTWQAFFSSTALGDCPSSFTGMMTGRDGHLYVLARAGGVGGGALYRILHDEAARPREVSAPNSYVPLRIGKTGAASDIEVRWEDLREDAMQVGDNGSVPTARVRSYTLWQGSLADLLDGNATLLTQSAVAGDVAGTEVNSVVRKQTISVTPGLDQYFLVSGRGANLEGTTGSGDWKPPQGLDEYPGYAVTDLCTTIGPYAPPSQANLFKCAPEITLFDHHGIQKKLSDYRGQPIWLDFPAEWCAPCNSQANEMEAIYLDYKDRGVVAISALMDEEDNGPDWDGRPTQAECRDWADRPGAVPDHTFECWADPVHCSSSPCGASTQEGWPKFNAFGALPTNALIDQGGRVVWTDAGWSVEGIIRNRLNVLVGSSDSCLH